MKNYNTKITVQLAQGGEITIEAWKIMEFGAYADTEEIPQSIYEEFPRIRYRVVKKHYYVKLRPLGDIIEVTPESLERVYKAREEGLL